MINSLCVGGWYDFWKVCITLFNFYWE